MLAARGVRVVELLAKRRPGYDLFEPRLQDFGDDDLDGRPRRSAVPKESIK